MNITFLIGNGFDRALGFETGYDQFYKWYVDQPSEGLPHHVQAFRKEIDNYINKVPNSHLY